MTTKFDTQGNAEYDCSTVKNIWPWVDQGSLPEEGALWPKGAQH